MILDFQLPRSTPKSPDPVRLDGFLREALPEPLRKSTPPLEVNNTRLRRLILSGSVRVNRQACRNPAWTLRPGDKISVSLDPEKFSARKDPGDLVWDLTPAAILYEDEGILVLNKPAGLPTEGTVVADRASLASAAQRYLQGENLKVPHRLDKETSGVILLVKDPRLNKRIHDIFAQREARKTYLALTVAPQLARSWEPGRCFQVENRLGRISPQSKAAQWGAVADGVEAKTEFSLLSRGAHTFLVEARPFTGRTHQIRVHLAGLGLPLLGDVLYGGPASWQGQDILRVMLHAQRLEIPHPVTRESLVFEAPVPPDFAKAARLAGFSGFADREPGVRNKKERGGT